MYPPTNKNIFDALKYTKDAISSYGTCILLSPPLLLTNLLSKDEDTTTEAAKYQHAILTQAVAASQPEGNTSHFRLLLAS